MPERRTTARGDHRAAKIGLSAGTVLGVGAAALGGYVLWRSLQNGNGHRRGASEGRHAHS